MACREAAKFIVETNPEAEYWDVSLNNKANSFKPGNEYTAGCYWNRQGANLWWNRWGVEANCKGLPYCRTICEKKGLPQIYN